VMVRVMVNEIGMRVKIEMRGWVMNCRLEDKRWKHGKWKLRWILMALKLEMKTNWKISKEIVRKANKICEKEKNKVKEQTVNKPLVIPSSL
jgi:hypothetical protein